MFDHQSPLELLERAEREVPHCPTCGLPNVPVAHDDGTVWLECVSLGEPKSVLRRVVTLDLAPHTRQLVVPAEAPLRTPAGWSGGRAPLRSGGGELGR